MNKKALMTAIIICWVVLAVCFIIKLFGGKYFEIATSNNTFKAVCAFVDNHLWLQDIIAFCTSLLTTVWVNLAVLRKKWFSIKQFVVVLFIDIFAFAFVILGDFIKNDVISIVGFIASLLPLCVCPMILSKKVLRSIFAYVLYMLFQVLSVLVKGLAIDNINSDSTLVALIYGVDLYIMLILFYLHANLSKDKVKYKIKEKGDNDNG